MFLSDKVTSFLDLNSTYHLLVKIRHMYWKRNIFNFKTIYFTYPRRSDPEMAASLDPVDELIFEEDEDLPVEDRRAEEEMEEGEISGPEESNSRPPLFSKSVRSSGLQITIGNNRRDGSDTRHLPVLRDIFI